MSPRFQSGALLIALLIILCLRQISDPDIWFYLVMARETLALGHLPDTEFYVYPALGEPAHFSAVGFGLIHYAAYQFTGFAGMALINALLCGGALFVFLLAARIATRNTLPLWLGLAPVAIAYVIAEFRMTYRPETTLFLFLAFEILLLELWLADQRPMRLLWIPVFAFLLAQLHTTTVFIWIVALCYFIHWIADNLRHIRSHTTQLAWITGCCALSLLLPLINPYGHTQLIVLIQSVGVLFSFSSPGDNPEYLPVLITEYRFHFIVLAGLLTAAWGANPKRRLVDLLLGLGFGWLALRYVRNLGLFALIAIVPLSLGLGQITTLCASANRWARIALGALSLALMGGTAMASGNWGIGVRAQQFPVLGAEAIRRTVPRGNVLNFFHHGSYLAWSLGNPYKIAIDGHFVTPTRATGYHDGMFRADPGWEHQLATDQVVAIVSPATLPFSGELIPLVERLASYPGWSLVAIDPEALTFVPAHLAKHALPSREVWQQALREANQVIKENPNPTRALATQALASERLSQAGFKP